MHTYLSTDWLEVDRIGFSTMVKVVLTDKSEAYLISVTDANGKPEAESLINAGWLFIGSLTNNKVVLQKPT